MFIKLGNHALIIEHFEYDGYHVRKGKGSSGRQKLKIIEENAKKGDGFYCVSPNAKYLARLNLRLWLESGASAQIFVEYDSGGTWEHLGSLQGYGLRPFTLPVKVRRCDHLRLKITGQGNFQLYAVTKTIEQGSDLV